MWDRDALYNNTEDVAGSPLKSLAKLAYYHAFALLYGLVGAFAQVWQDGWGMGGRQASLGGCIGGAWSGCPIAPPRAHHKLRVWKLSMLVCAAFCCLQAVMVNSSWTRRHIAELWWR